MNHRRSTFAARKGTQNTCVRRVLFSLFPSNCPPFELPSSIKLPSFHCPPLELLLYSLALHRLCKKNVCLFRGHQSVRAPWLHTYIQKPQPQLRTSTELEQGAVFTTGLGASDTTTFFRQSSATKSLSIASKFVIKAASR